MRSAEGNKQRRYSIKEVNSLLAYAASFVLTGIPPVVCESVLDEVYASIRKSLSRLPI